MGFSKSDDASSIVGRRCVRKSVTVGPEDFEKLCRPKRCQVMKQSSRTDGCMLQSHPSSPVNGAAQYWEMNVIIG